MKLNNLFKRFVGIRKQFLLLVISLIFIVLLILWLFNMLFLSYVYRRAKIEDMEDVFTQLDQAAQDGLLYDNSYDRVFEQISFNNNLDIAIVSYNGSVILSSGKEKSNTINRLLDAVLSGKKNDDYLVHNSSYDITMDKDNYVNEEYLVLTGTLSDGNLIMIRYAVENMNLSIEVFDKTLIIVAVISFVLAFLIAEMFSRRFTAPIVELTEISKKMTELDFGVKYESRAIRTEVDILGEHMNTMSEELERSLIELEKANIELKKDIEIKKKTEEMRKEFLSNVSHELKTPISIIQGYAEGLAEGMADDPESREYYCEVIVDESAKMNKMVGRIMGLNELEYGEEPQEKEEFNITELIRGIVNSSSILIEQSDVTVEYDVDSDITVVSVPDLVEMAFTNYFSNAVHHCKYDKVIRITQVDKGDTVCISVYNSGDPIPEESINRVWERFYKVDKARTREYGGNGIGLSIVQLAIDMLNGKYGVYNSSNGVTFWFEIFK